jgi:hypothetical protein
MTAFDKAGGSLSSARGPEPKRFMRSGMCRSCEPNEQIVGIASARMLSLTVPATLLSTADEVIDSVPVWPGRHCRDYRDFGNKTHWEAIEGR